MKITQNNIKDIYKCKQANHDILTLKGYQEVETLFVDSSGLGQENEPALTANQFESKLAILLAEHKSLYAFITNAGQFQVYITLYKKTGKSQVEKIALNTYKIPTATGYKIQYYNTVIVEKKNGKTILNSGGYQTKTTKERINEVIAPSYISQKNFNWFINKNGEKIPFCDGITI
jgi:hypothetical protein